MIACLRTKNVQEKVEFDDLWHVPLRFMRSRDQIVKPHDILISTANSLNLLGKTAFVTTLPEESTFGTFIVLLRAKEGFLAKYLYYGMQRRDFRQQVQQSASTTTNISNISTEKLKQLTIPIPPLPEQERIVARIEELFSDLDKGVEALQTIKAQLKVYRQAVLKKAFDGDFGGTTKTGSIKIADFADVFTGATPLTSNMEFYENGSIPWITSGELNEPTVRYARKFITEKAVAETNAKIIPKHALLLAMYGEGKTRGKCSELLIDAATNQAIASIVIKHTMHKNYVKWFLVYNYHSTRAISSGGVQPNINLSKVRDIEMPLYDFPMQEQIITEIESRLSVCDKIEQTVDESLAKAESLRQSILKKAFEGRL